MSSKARFLPWLIAWSTLLISARVWDQLPKGTDIPLGQAVFTFGGVPLIALATVLAASAAEKRTSTTLGRGSQFVLAWVISFLAAIHAMVLALALGKLSSLTVALPPAIAVFFLGLGPLVAMLEPKSAMGIRTKATLESDAIWRKTHLILGVSFAVAGGVGGVVSLLELEVPVRMAASAISGVAALLVAIAYAARRVH